MRFLVWGGSGQLGSVLSRLLRESVVTPTDLVVAPRDISVSDSARVGAFTVQHEPNVVINVAAFTAVDEAERNPEVAFQTNFVGAENVAMAARMVGARLLYVSTESVFNGTSSCPVTENDDCDPPSQYARSKRAGEMAVLGIAENNWIIRTSWLYSRSGTANFPHRLIERLQRTNGPVPVVTDLWGQPTPAELFARWLLRFVAAQPAGGIYHAACSGIVSKHDWAVAIARQCGFKTERITKVLQSSFEDLAPRPTRVELDCSRFMQVTNSTLESWDEAFTTFGCQNT